MAFNKYRRSITFCDGYNFDSKLEASVYQHLKLLEKAGEIKLLQTQASVYLTDARILYKPDFLIEKDGEQIWVEAKGIETPVWRIKKRLWKHYGPGVLWIFKGKRGSLKLVEELVPISTSHTNQ